MAEVAFNPISKCSDSCFNSFAQGPSVFLTTEKCAASQGAFVTMKSKAKTMMRNKSAADQRMQERLLLCPFSQSFAPGNQAHCKKTLNNRNS